MRKNCLCLLLLIYFITKVQYSDGNDETRTYEGVIDDLVLVNTLSYNKSGNINSLSWITALGSPFASNFTVVQHRHQYLVAASVSTFQVWNAATNATTANISSNSSNTTNQSSTRITTEWDLLQLIPSNNIARAVSFSPNGKWLALGDDSGMIQIWSVSSQPWKPIESARTDVDGKIRYIAWHSSSLFLGASGIKFGFIVLDGNRNWTRSYVEPRSATIPLPPADTYVHYMDWSPANEFVVDTTIYELHRPSNIFNDGLSSTTPMTSRAVEILNACRLCTLSQWSPDGQFIATAFGSEIRIFQVKSIVDTNQGGRANSTHWASIHNLTTVQETYMVITALEWSPDGRYLAAGGAGNHSLFVYDTSFWSNTPLVVPTSTKYGIDSLAWRPDSQQIAIGTFRVVEIREIRLKEVAKTAISFYPSSAPSDGSVLLSNSPSTSIKPVISIAGMAGIGIAAVISSFSCVALLFHQRLKFISKRNASKEMRRIEHSENNAYREVENTMSDDDYDCPSPLDRVISIPQPINPIKVDKDTI